MTNVLVAQFDGNEIKGPSDRVVEYLYWLLIEAEHMGQQHELANDRRDICISEANRVMVRQLRHHFGPFPAHFSAPTPLHTRRGVCFTWCAILPHA